MENKNAKPGLLALIWASSPFVILVVWLLLMLAYFTVGLAHSVSLPIIAVTAIWFVVWLIIRSNEPTAHD